jgi:predicted transcriptional regulator of viral defense system
MEVDRVHLEDANMLSFRTLFVYRTLRTRKQKQAHKNKYRVCNVKIQEMDRTPLSEQVLCSTFVKCYGDDER